MERDTASRMGLEKSGGELTQRDLALIYMAYEYGGCLTDHIRRRFFATPGASTSCYRRIAHLTQQGFFSSIRLPSTTGTGSGKAFLTIGPKSRPLLAEMLGIPRTELARPIMDSPMFISHHLALCDVRLAFEMAAEHSDIFKVADWTGDRELHQSPIRVKDFEARKKVLIPDAAFTLTFPDGIEQNFFVEMDMGTEGSKRLQEKLGAYLVHKVDPTRVLFIVPDQKRQAAIATWALKKAQDLGGDPTIFWTATKQSVAEDTVLSSPIWQVVGGPETVAIQDVKNVPVLNEVKLRRPSDNGVNEEILYQETDAENKPSISTGEEENSLEESAQSLPLDPNAILAEMNYWHGVRRQQSNELETLETRQKAFVELLKYLSFVPVGQSSERRRYTKEFNEFRKHLMEERGHICEACSRKYEPKDLQIHHTNYYKGDDPEYLKVVCGGCHKIINTLSGMTNWFEDRMQRHEAHKNKYCQTSEENISTTSENAVPAYTRLFRRNTVRRVNIAEENDQSRLNLS